MAFDPAKGAEVVRTWRDLSHGSDDIGWAVGSVTAPPEPFVPQEWYGRRVVGVLGMIAGPHDEAERSSRRSARSGRVSTSGSRCRTR